MWQDSLALLIVVSAVIWLTRGSVLAFWRRCTGHPRHAQPATSGGCSGCASGSSCSKVQVQIYPVANGRRERFSSGDH